MSRCADNGFSFGECFALLAKKTLRTLRLVFKRKARQEIQRKGHQEQPNIVDCGVKKELVNYYREYLSGFSLRKTTHWNRFDSLGWLQLLGMSRCARHDKASWVCFG